MGQGVEVIGDTLAEASESGRLSCRRPTSALIGLRRPAILG